MPTPAERKALVFLLAVAVVGSGVRAIGVQRFEREVAQADSRPVKGAERALQEQIEAVDSALEARERKAASKKSKPGSSRSTSATRVATTASLRTGSSSASGRSAVTRSSLAHHWMVG